MFHNFFLHHSQGGFDWKKSKFSHYFSHEKITFTLDNMLCLQNNAMLSINYCIIFIYSKVIFVLIFSKLAYCALDEGWGFTHRFCEQFACFSEKKCERAICS